MSLIGIPYPVYGFVNWVLARLSNCPLRSITGSDLSLCPEPVLFILLCNVGSRWVERVVLSMHVQLTWDRRSRHCNKELFWISGETSKWFGTFRASCSLSLQPWRRLGCSGKGWPCSAHCVLFGPRLLRVRASVSLRERCPEVVAKTQRDCAYEVAAQQLAPPPRKTGFRYILKDLQSIRHRVL